VFENRIMIIIIGSKRVHNRRIENVIMAMDWVELA
jgi:hypothetical protein